MIPSPPPFVALALLPVAALLAASAGAAAQSVGDLSPSPAPAAEAPAAASAKPERADAPAANSAPDTAAIGTPSRYIGENDLAAYVKSVSSILSIRNRTTDPFGQYQDPDARPIIKTPVAKSTRRMAPAQSFPFSEIINRIKVNTVMPAEDKFLIGTRTFRAGETMNLTFRMKNIPVEITSVSAREIEFRNIESGEKASLRMFLLPAGMTPGSGGIQAPGMVREQRNAPVDLDSIAFPEDEETNR